MALRSIDLTDAERAKFELLARGVALTAPAHDYITEQNARRRLTSADYASTSGVILRLTGDVWVNAPVAQHNSNFVDDTPYSLELDGSGLVLRGPTSEIGAEFWLAPAWHDERNELDEPLTSYGFAHTDRVRVSPIEGCSMTCKFCDLPYEFRYRTKRVDGLIEVAERAVADPVQPSAHVLFSGGTPHPRDYDYVRECYASLVERMPETPIDIMMVPLDEVMDPAWLATLGIDEVSLNIEIYNQDIARKIMRRKHAQGLDHYLGALERAAEHLGGHRVRSMLMVGLEPMEDTLAGVRAIAERGCVPVLSPFRPDPKTPLRDEVPPTAAYLAEVYARSLEVTRELGVPLGPSCIPCSHNTLTLASSGHGDAHRHYGRPKMA